MERLGQTLKKNAKIMKSKVTKYAIMGVFIAVLAIILATLLSSYFEFGNISFDNIVKSQKTNVTLWFLDIMPFVFAFWGQYTSSIMAYEASTMVIDQTEDLRDMTIALEHRAAHDATHDTVTDLPNRVLMMDRLEQAVHSAKRQETMIALLILGIDNFKEINDTLGHFSGDRLLKQIVSRFQGVMRTSDTLAKYDSDQFAVLMPMDKESGDIATAVKKILKIFLEPFVVDRLTLEVQISIGIAIYPEHGKDIDTIIQKANVALVAAKQDIKKYAVYSSNLDKFSSHRLTLLGELRQAIENDELVLHYQPQINLKKNSITGVEALVRWEHPEHGYMRPDEFIPMAERTGLIKQLSIWVLEHALKQGEEWHNQNFKLNISINLSPTTFLDPELPNLIIGMLSLYEIPAKYVTLEITEGSMIKDPDLAMEILTRLTSKGIKISIDDFGTGYSSLVYLKEIPANEIKIDKSFVSDMSKNENDAVIVKSIIDLGHNLSLIVVAEGAEDKETVVRLKALGCDVIQGYYYSGALTNEDFLKWLPKKKTKN